jgi:hypothetical protein
VLQSLHPPATKWKDNKEKPTGCIVCRQDASAVSEDDLLWLVARCAFSTETAAIGNIAAHMQLAYTICTDNFPLPWLTPEERSEPAASCCDSYAHAENTSEVRQEVTRSDNFTHAGFTTDDGQRRAAKLRRALDASTAIAAATCRADALPEPLLEGYPGRAKLLGGHEGGRRAPPAARRQKILVGLARASSDTVFVAVVDQLLVLPELRRQGLGRRCVLPAMRLGPAHPPQIALKHVSFVRSLEVFFLVCGGTIALSITGWLSKQAQHQQQPPAGLRRCLSPSWKASRVVQSFWVAAGSGQRRGGRRLSAAEDSDTVALRGVR